ncbi:MAG: 30S ribosomal protein S17 [Fibrobacterota bacterium]
MSERNKRKTRQGIVKSNSMDKTVVVSIERNIPHSLYKRFVKTMKSYKAHDEKNECNVDDVVEIMETRPYSKDKNWRVTRILERAK